MEKYIPILRDLIQFESVNDGEEEVAHYIADLFKDYDNVETEIIDSYPGRSNVTVKLKGNEKGKIFAVSGHLDVVAAGEGWTHPPFEGVIEGNKIYGRGTCHMKACVAAGIYMLLDIIESKTEFAGEIWFMGTVGEEVGMQGALDLVESGYLNEVDAIITPEPTKRDGENQGIFASKGSIMYEVHSAGKAAHSSMPEIGINAIMALADFIRKVQDAFDAVTADPALQNKNLGSTLNVFSMIEGGVQFNSVPDKAVVKGNIRTVPEFASEEAIALFEKAIEENNRDESRAKLSLELIQVLDPAEASRKNDLIDALIESAPYKNVKIKPLIGTCELSRFIHISDDIQLLVYGPGLTQQAHVVDEYIELDEYVDTIRIFKDTGLKFLAKEFMTHFTRKKAPDQRFSLHDMRIIAMERRGDDLFLKMDYGYIDLEKNDGVNGDLLITDVSFDDSYVYMIDFGRAENIGRFSGEKMTLEDFLPRFEANAAIEVYSEYDGFRFYYVKGFYCLGEGVSEITLDFYFTGSVEYVVYE